MGNPDASTLPKELRKLVKKRETLKSSINSINDYFHKFIPTVSSIRQLQIRLSRLTDFISELNSTQEAISDLELGFDDEVERTAFEDFTFTLVADMEDQIAKHSPTEASNSMHLSNQSHSLNNETMKLPAISIPTFNGDIENWASFIDTFNALFHNNPGLTNVQRLHYLKSSVSNTAADVIKNFSITSDNYQAAYDELVKQYENKALTIQTHIRALLNSPKVQVNSAVELKRLHYHVNSHVRSLIALNQPVQHWDAWLTTIICCQFDPTTAGEWQLLQTSKELPAFKDIEAFLSKRIAAYEVGCMSLKSEVKQTHHRGKTHDAKAFFTKKAEFNYSSCALCAAPHRIYACDQFNKMSIPERKDVISKFKLCFNCMNFGHQVSSCKYPGCPRCGKKHNSKLHTDSNLMPEQGNPIQTEPQISIPASSVLHVKDNTKNASSSTSSVMLATAVVYILDSDGNRQRCRAILDSGSQLNFITSSCAQRLHLNQTNVSLSISGIGTMSSSTVRLMPCIVSSQCQNYHFTVEFHSLPTITQRLPYQMFGLDQVNIPDYIKNNLADPHPNIPAAVDILFGAELFYDIFLGARQQLSKHLSVHHTKLGWILVGKLFERSLDKLTTTMLAVPTSSISALSLFTSTTNDQHNEEVQAEEHFISTVKRDEDGKFVVRLPVNDKISFLGDSRTMAQKRFYNLERRFAKDADLAKQYDMFISEYLKLKHMELASPNASGPKYYLPHHPVFKASSTTTKLRVVFDGSAKTQSGIALNDVLLKGPKVQSDIFHILLRFRSYQVAITADVEKMYRQVSVAPEDRDLQRILYRKSPADQLQEYRLCTVTYGTKSASYLATRCLADIGRSADNPKLQRVITQDFYVDDLLSGGSSVDECYQIYNSLLTHLQPAGFSLRKWCSNSADLIDKIPTACDDPTFVLKLTEEEMVTALGLTWQPATDNFRFAIKPWHSPQNMTKRILLSDINSVYDPIGLIAPLLIKGKIFIQQLWSFKIDWDEVLSVEFKSKWTKFYSSLQRLTDLSVPRRALCSYASIQLHGYCDASQSAFGACLYLRSVTHDGEVHTHLFTSKSRVAPLKATTIPRLELCGALLLAELVTEIQAELRLVNIIIPDCEVYLWSDSTIVLAWIKSKCIFQVYVSNRIAGIQDLTTPEQWNHVPTADNPADLISRGVDVETMISADLWWQGPMWLGKEKNFWPGVPNLPSELPELRKVKLILSVTNKEPFWLLQKFSTWSKLLRTTALIQRFVFNCKAKKLHHEKYIGFISVEEMNKAKYFWLMKTQSDALSTEMSDLRAGKMVHRSSCLKALNPFIDNQGLIRVGGRLTNASGNHNFKHPIVLPSKSLVSNLIFKYEHIRLIHAGPQALLAHISMNYWPIRGRQIAAQTVRKCITCFRAQPRITSPLMAPLPSVRVTVARPFSSSGVDLCGPIFVRSGLRKITPIKSYICVFVCMVTRAIHLELVSSLSTEDFLAALSRFMSRRGQCENLHSDNGTNFVGADRALKTYFKTTAKSKKVHEFLTMRDITWHFIPPAAPHFGGLWESAVKSAKKHLVRISKGVLLTFEETTTLLCQVEAALNSRPLYPISSDPADFNVLTPGHFLIGGPLMLPPEPDVSSVPQNRLKRYKLMQKQMQVFWKRWSLEYLPQLQRRGKWTKPHRNFSIGDLAILRDDNMPPLKWPLVRVTAIHPGADGCVRAVTVRNSSGSEFKRPTIKLSLLPTNKDEDEDKD